MLDMLLLLAAAAQDEPQIIIPRDPRPGPTAAEFRTLSQPHPNDFPEGSFPDLAVKELRIDGDTLHVLVANEGRLRASGPIRVTAQAQFAGFRSQPSAERIGTLKAGESKWVALRDFSVKSAGPSPVAALQDALSVSASVSLPPSTPAALDRTGQLRDRVVQEQDESNNSLTAAGSALGGRP